MVAVLPRYDVELTVGGVTRGFMLARDPQSKALLYNRTLIQEIVAQQRTDTFSYQHRDPRLDMVASFEETAYGAGFEDAPDIGSVGFKGYNYTQGIDLSWHTRGYLAAEKQTGGSTTQAPIQIVYTSLGLFAVTTRYVFEWTGAAWTQRLDTGGTVTNTDLRELSNSNGTYLL